MYGIAPVTHGVTDQTAELRGIRLTETSHSPNARIARHRHAYPAVTLVLSGGFLEDFGAGHTHDLGHEIFLVLEGRAELTIEGETAILNPGQCAIARADQ